MTYTKPWRLAVMVLLLANPLRILSEAAAGEVETGSMTWVEIRDAVAKGQTTIIIPTGGTEQNGPHMITGKHNVIVAAAARRAAEKLGDALVAPVLAYTPEGDLAKLEGHTAYPGTISITQEAFESVLEGAARSFAVHGFKMIVFMGDSGPNQAGQQRVAEKLSAEFAETGVRIISAANYYAGAAPREMLINDGETPDRIGTHAGIRDTSELLSVLPGGVRMEKRSANELGANGDARHATAERGAKLLELRIAEAVAEIRAAKNMPPPLPAKNPWFGWFAPKN